MATRGFYQPPFFSFETRPTLYLILAPISFPSLVCSKENVLEYLAYPLCETKKTVTPKEVGLFTEETAVRSVLYQHLSSLCFYTNQLEDKQRHSQRIEPLCLTQTVYL